MPALLPCSGERCYPSPMRASGSSTLPPATAQHSQLALFGMTFIYALSLKMTGPLLPLVIDDLQLRLSQAGLLVSYQQLGGLIAIVLTSLVADRYRKPLLITASFAVYAGGLLLTGAAPDYRFLALAFFAVGASSRIFDAVANADTAEQNPSRSARSLGYLHTWFAAGALCGPLYVGTLIELAQPWRRAFTYLSLAALAAMVIYVAKRRPGASRAEEVGAAERSGGVIQVVTAPRMWCASLVMLGYIIHQAGVSVWLPMYLRTSLSAGLRLSATSVSVYWVGILIGRILSARFSHRVSLKNQLIWGQLLGALLMLWAFLLRSPVLLTAAGFVAGTAGGGVVPNLITLSCSWFPANTATASSVAFLMAATAHMVSPFLIATVAERYGFDIGFLIPIVALAVAAAAAWALAEPGPRRKIRPTA